MKHQRGFIPIEWIVYGLIAIAIASVGGYAVYIYKDRQSLQKDNNFLKDSIEANKKQAAELLAKREAENKTAIEGYIKLARESDADYEKRIADIRARANVAGGLRLNIPNGDCGSPAGQAGEGRAGAPEAAATASQLLRELIDLAASQATLADEVAVYAASCHRQVID